MERVDLNALNPADTAQRIGIDALHPIILENAVETTAKRMNTDFQLDTNSWAFPRQRFHAKAQSREAGGGQQKEAKKLGWSFR